MDENEKLYVTLMLDQMPEDCETKVLINQGYLNTDLALTQKALDFMAGFIDSKKEDLYQTIKEAGEGGRRSTIMQRVGIRQFGVFTDIADKLVVEGRLKKNNGKYYPLD